MIYRTPARELDNPDRGVGGGAVLRSFQLLVVLGYLQDMLSRLYFYLYLFGCCYFVGPAHTHNGVHSSISIDFVSPQSAIVLKMS